ncbi:hypothetical protein FJU08_22275 [Martelella alba]|uniref:Uncharacterized protein n=1 Tax=Martelella alba TaxID=2590451 RepID=A0A506TWG0_9HYPH|nr:hypothetical protein [Martelella alba]TPW26412.1 hypothetical protein FJU08_22275 [Martelella alba]
MYWLKISLSLCLISLFSSCVLTQAAKLETLGQHYERLSVLDSIGNQGGDLVVGYVDNWRDKNIQLPSPPIAIYDRRPRPASSSENLYFLSAFYSNSLSDEKRWDPPDIELGALYYVPKRFEGSENFKVVQKLCGITKSHQLGDVIISDSPGPQIGSNARRKIIVSGSVAKGLLSGFISSIAISAEAEYVIEVEVKNIRKMKIHFTDQSKLVYRKISSGDKCRKEIDDRNNNQIFFLEEIYYGEINIVQAGRLTGNLNVKLVDINAEFNQSNGETYILAFKWFRDMNLLELDGEGN